MRVKELKPEERMRLSFRVKEAVLDYMMSLVDSRQSNGAVPGLWHFGLADANGSKRDLDRVSAIANQASKNDLSPKGLIRELVVSK
jgi:hypothetical protein